MIKINIENSATREQLAEFERRLTDLAPRSMLKELREDIQDKVSKEEFTAIVAQQDSMQRDVSRFATVQEVADRLQAFN